MPIESREPDGRVKLQIPVDAALAEMIDELAHRMGHSRSWMASELLGVVVEHKQRFADWWTWRLINAGVVKPVKAVMRLFGKKKPMALGTDVVYVQAYASRELVETISAWAEQMAQSENKMAALLLRCAAEDHGWVIKMVTSRMITKLGGKPYHAGKPRQPAAKRESA